MEPGESGRYARFLRVLLFQKIPKINAARFADKLNIGGMFMKLRLVKRVIS